MTTGVHLANNKKYMKKSGMISGQINSESSLFLPYCHIKNDIFIYFLESLPYDW